MINDEMGFMDNKPWLEYWSKQFEKPYKILSINLDNPKNEVIEWN